MRNAAYATAGHNPDGTYAPLSLPRKAATDSVASSTTLQSDDDLVVALAASTVYTFDALLMVYGSGGDLRLGFTVHTGASVYWMATGPGWALSGTEGDGGWAAPGTEHSVAPKSAARTRLASMSSGWPSEDSSSWVVPPGTSSSSGAQNTSSGTATELRAGPWLAATSR